MYRKCLFILSMMFLILLCSQKTVLASSLDNLQNDDIHLLLVYTNQHSTETVQTRKLDLLFHHFTSNVKIVPDDEVTEDDFKTATHVFYYGEDKGKVNEATISLFEQFSGPKVVMGKNREQIPSFDYFNKIKEIKVNEVGLDADPDSTRLLDYSVTVDQLEETDDMNVLLSGYKNARRYPLLIEQDHQYVFATDRIDGVLRNYLAEALHNILPNNHPNEHRAYLRLEDIHPFSDEQKIAEVGEYLNERDIPFILVVIPVYIKPHTGERVYLADSPQLVEVLKQLQEEGASVVAHGYTHQYRDSETGEGFEFWDVENEQFITSREPTEEIELIKSPDQFANQEDYKSYIKPLKEKEKQYVEDKLIKSIHSLTDAGLYPLGFEAPHYTMSQQGYSVASNYFSSIFGQVQLSDEDWELMSAPPYVTSATFLNEMVLYPETIGYVEQSTGEPSSVGTKQKIHNTLVVRDSVIGGFYHPYLGVEHLPEFIEAYESIPGLTWLDLKETNQTTHTSHVEVTSGESVNLLVENDVRWWDGILRENTLSLLDKILWGITIIVFTFILLFLLFTVYLRTQQRKRLFKERKNDG